MCRKTKLTPELQNRLIEYLKAGNYIEPACAAVGISKETFYRWTRTKHDFNDAVLKAQSEAEMRNVVLIQNAAKDTWQAAAWYLERKHYDRWGRKDKIEANVTVKSFVDELISLDDPTNEQDK